jgi:arginine deiminase
MISPIPRARVLAQDAAPAVQPRSEFFSGVVTVLDQDKITVLKTVLGKNSETRTFVITAETRVEGKLRLKARVTVRYAKDEEGDRALRIIVRASQKK